VCTLCGTHTPSIVSTNQGVLSRTTLKVKWNDRTLCSGHLCLSRRGTVRRVETLAFIFAWRRMWGQKNEVERRLGCYCQYIFTCFMSLDVHLLKIQIWCCEGNRIAGTSLFESKAYIFLVSRQVFDTLISV
jgi:hypothetical protein